MKSSGTKPEPLDSLALWVSCRPRTGQGLGSLPFAKSCSQPRPLSCRGGYDSGKTVGFRVGRPGSVLRPLHDLGQVTLQFDAHQEGPSEQTERDIL